MNIRGLTTPNKILTVFLLFLVAVSISILYFGKIEKGPVSMKIENIYSYKKTQEVKTEGTVVRCIPKKDGGIFMFLEDRKFVLPAGYLDQDYSCKVGNRLEVIGIVNFTETERDVWLQLSHIKILKERGAISEPNEFLPSDIKMSNIGFFMKLLNQNLTGVFDYSGQFSEYYDLSFDGYTAVIPKDQVYAILGVGKRYNLIGTPFYTTELIFMIFNIEES